ncbi:MAG: LuxR C-terminal-related transcriptional regulator [Chloroflexota bacterium]
MARPRLAQRLADAFQSPLCLVSAGAGFGKSTLIAEWKQPPANSGTRLGWLSLDKEDGDPVRFWTYVIAALQTVQPGFGGEALALLLSPQPPPATVLLPLLINELAALTEDVVLVLDDYHHIDSPRVNESVSFLIDRMPPRLHLVVLTRADPPWPLARWRARGLLVELRASDLRFTPEEAEAYLREATGLTLSTSDVATLEARTEGWIVGLQMAALSLKGRTDVGEFVRTFAGTNRYILEFLVEEVLNGQPQDVQEFLLQTSILEQLTAPLCDAVMGGADSQQILDALLRDNLFLVLLDDDRVWYRYHHLFADLLRAKLRQTQPDRVSELYARAAGWCEKEGLIGEALGYHLAANNHEGAAQLAEQRCVDALRRSDTTFIPKLARLPDAVSRRRPWLAAYRALTDIIFGRWEHAKTMLSEAEKAARIEDLPTESGELSSFISLMSAYIAELEGVGAEYAEAADTFLTALPSRMNALRNTFGYWLGVSRFLRGDFPAAEATWTRISEEDLQTGATNSLAGNLDGIIQMKVAQGRLTEASNACRQRLSWMDERGRWRFFRAGDLSIALGDIHREGNQLEEALELVDQGIKDNELWQQANSRANGYAAKARVLAAMGQVEPAFAALRELEGLLGSLSILPNLRSEIAACKVTLYLAKGDVVSAARWVDEGPLGDGGRPTFRRERDGIALARLLIAQGEHAKALALLARLEGAARLGERSGRLIEILALQAKALYARKEAARALSVLGQALTLGEPEGYLRVFVAEGEPMADLLSRLDGLPPPPSGPVRFSREYLARILAAFGSSVSSSTSGAPAIHPRVQVPSARGGGSSLLSGGASLIEPLSERELEVLRLMATGLTNKQIAIRLIVAPGTVKAHVHNICGKLGSQNRTHAIARATELQLL